MAHLADGLLRVMVDEPLATSAPARWHLEQCQACQERFQEIGERAQRIGQLLEAPTVEVDLEAALGRLRAAGSAGSPRRRAWLAAPQGVAALLGTRRRRLVVALAAAVVTVFATSLLSGLAQNLIVVFRQPNRVVVVPIRPSEVSGLYALADYGTITYSSHAVTHRAADATAAAAEAGFSPLTPAPIPAGVPVIPTYQVQPAYTVTFTFDAAKAQAAAARKGSRMQRMPPDIDGASVSIDVGATIYAEYGGGGSGPPALGTVRMRPPTVRTSGVTISRLQEYLLSQPGIAPDLASRIRSIDNPGRTFPLLVLSADGHVEPTLVQSVAGSMLKGSARYGTGLAWLKDGFVVAVYGSSPLEELEAAAEGAE